MHQNEWFQVWFFKNFLGRGSPTPLPASPDPSSRFFSGFALGSGFALNSRALRALDSGFALDTRFRLRPYLSIGDLGLPPPPNKFLDPPLDCVTGNARLCQGFDHVPHSDATLLMFVRSVFRFDSLSPDVCPFRHAVIYFQVITVSLSSFWL